MNKPQISFQLYSARKFPPVRAQLEALAEIGYAAVEPYGAVYEEDPAGFRKMTDAAGLRCPTAHIPLMGLDADRPRYFDIARTLGVETIVVPFVPPDRRPTDAAGWRAIATRLAGHAEAAGDAGFELAWHNHDFEYAALPDGMRIIDLFLAAPKVLWEADVGWISRAKADAREELIRYADKIVALHLKDVAPEGATAEDGWADVGSGVTDWPALWPAIARTRAATLVVEHDNPLDWKRCAERSFAFLSRLLPGAGL